MSAPTNIVDPSRPDWYSGRDQNWETYPAEFINLEKVWKSGVKHLKWIAKGAAIAIVGGIAGFLILIFLPFNILTGILAAAMFALSGIGWGQSTIYKEVYDHVFCEAACLQWASWNHFGGVDPSSGHAKIQEAKAKM